MLVLSRRVDEELVFPSLDVRIKILRSVGNRVRLGIAAPEFIEVFRGECVDSTSTQPAQPISDHRLRNHINAVRLALELYDRQMTRGDVDGANQTFLRLVAQLRKAEVDSVVTVANGDDSKSTGPKVLVVDDDANERELLAGLLQMDGCQVKTATDGLEAIEVLQRDAVPDVVLLDMQMPRMDGKKTLEAIRDRWRDVLVFGVSGTSASDNDITVGGPRGIDEWFEKPLNPTQLVNCMHERLKPSTTASA